MSKLQLEDKLNKLREEYKSAHPDKRYSIELKARVIKLALKHNHKDTP